MKYSWLRGYDLVAGTAWRQVSCLQDFSWSGVQNFASIIRAVAEKLFPGSEDVLMVWGSRRGWW